MARKFKEFDSWWRSWNELYRNKAKIILIDKFLDFFLHNLSLSSLPLFKLNGPRLTEPALKPFPNSYQEVIPSKNQYHIFLTTLHTSYWNRIGRELFNRTFTRPTSKTRAVPRFTWLGSTYRPLPAHYVLSAHLRTQPLSSLYTCRGPSSFFCAVTWHSQVFRAQSHGKSLLATFGLGCLICIALHSAHIIDDNPRD